MTTLTTLLALMAASIGIVLLAERFPATRRAMQSLTAAYTPGTCRSFLLDIPIFLPIVGFIVEAVARCNRFVALTALMITGIGLTILAAAAGKPGIALCLGLSWVVGSLVCPTRLRTGLYIAAIGMFLTVSGGLYFDELNLSIIVPVVGHPEAWNGNHFMWNSGIETLGLDPLVRHAEPTYQNFWGSWNILAMALFFIVYPVVMVKTGRRLYGMLFGYTEKQTGVSALFFERKRR